MQENKRKSKIFFPLTAAIISVLTLIISAVVLDGLQKKQAGVNSQLQRNKEVTEAAIKVLTRAYEEINQEKMYMAIFALNMSHPNISIIKGEITSRMFSACMFFATATYDEANASDKDKLNSTVNELRRLSKRYGDDCFSAIRYCGDKMTELEQAAERKQDERVTRRAELLKEQERLDRKESNIKFFATSIQFISILLVLVKDIFKKD